VGIFSENFLPELLEGVGRETGQEDYLRSASFRWSPTADNRMFGRTEAIGPRELREMRMFAEYFGRDRVAYESMVWKRWVYSGDLKELPALARQRPIVLIGAERVSSLGQRWNVPLFVHCEIPLSSYTDRRAILERSKQAVLETKAMASGSAAGRPLVLVQGGSFAYWLIARLHAWDPHVFYIDLGQALHIWFLDDRSMLMPWLLVTPKLLVDRCELAAFYREIGVRLAAPFV
jgi:hypothetical protein